MSNPAVKDPWFKFYPADWQSDELLAGCSLAARGLLAELICVMHKATPYGYLVINGVKPTDVELTRLARGSSVKLIKKLKSELISSGVLSRTDEGVLYSRRMVRAAQKSARAKEIGALGGNPALKKQHNAAVNHKGDAEVMPYILEARSKKENITGAHAPGFTNPVENSPRPVPNHRVLCAMALAEAAESVAPDGPIDFGEWAESVKRRLVSQGWAYPTGEALTAALDAVSKAHAPRRRSKRST